MRESTIRCDEDIKKERKKQSIFQDQIHPVSMYFNFLPTQRGSDMWFEALGTVSHDLCCSYQCYSERLL